MVHIPTAQRDYVVDAKLDPKGHEQIGSLDTVRGLTPPRDARVALIQSVSQNIRWKDDGDNPDVNTGMILFAGRDMLYTGDLTAIRFIETAASAEINVAYYF